MYSSYYVQALLNLRQKPSFEEILDTLESLGSINSRRDDSSEDSQTMFRFLMSITASPLEWLDEGISTELAQQRKDALYDLAAKKIAESCGRSAISEINRTFVIPASEHSPVIEIHLREPGIVEDNLGLKTWGTAHAIAARLPELRETIFTDLLCSKESRHSISLSNGRSYSRVKTRVLELGAGTGLLGIAVSKLWHCTVIATDLPQIQENLLFNARKNRTLLEQADMAIETQGHVICEILDWTNSGEALAGYASNAFEIVVAADPIYDDEHPQLVASMIKKYLAQTKDSRALVALPIRDRYSAGKAESLREYMTEYGLGLIHEREGEFQDPDWRNTDGNEADAVKFWYGVWSIVI